jgi:hypothetical protein
LSDLMQGDERAGVGNDAAHSESAAAFSASHCSLVIRK